MFECRKSKSSREAMRRTGLNNTNGLALNDARTRTWRRSIQQLVSGQRQEFDEIVGHDHVVHQTRGFGDVRHFGEQPDFLVEPALEQAEGEVAAVVERRFELEPLPQ